MSKEAKISFRAILAVLLALSSLACAAPLPQPQTDAAVEAGGDASPSLQKRSPVLPLAFGLKGVGSAMTAARGFFGASKVATAAGPAAGGLSRIAAFGRGLPGRLSHFHHKMPPGFISQQALPTGLMLAPGAIQTATAFRHRKDGLRQPQQQVGMMGPPGMQGMPGAAGYAPMGGGMGMGPGMGGY